jgi:Secretion system C-terminal sorting domain
MENIKKQATIIGFSHKPSINVAKAERFCLILFLHLKMETIETGYKHKLKDVGNGQGLKPALGFIKNYNSSIKNSIMFNINFNKLLFLFIVLINGHLLHAQTLQATMTSQGTNLIVKIRPTGNNVTTGFANMEFYVRYPSATTIVWGTPVVNATDFPSIAIQKNDPYTSITESGFTIVRFFLPPGTFTASKTYMDAVEYEVFRVSATGIGSANIEMMHRTAENPYVLTLVNETASTDWANAVKFYGAGASGAGASQSLPLMITLPLELLSFTGKQNAEGITLNWQTANEQNVSHFIVEKSSDIADKFVEIGKIKAIGNNRETPQYYSLFDAQPSFLNYYRLKMVDNDGGFNYSKILAFKGENKSNGIIGFYPNPVTNVLNVVLTNTNYKTATVSLVDITGRTLLTQSKAFDNQAFVLNTETVANGIYTVIVTIDGTQSLHKVVIAK